MGRHAIATLLVVVAACSPEVAATVDALKLVDAENIGPDPNDGAKSGTRLKLTWYELSDGARQWDGFYDAQRKETCYIYNWADGKQYCAPDYDGSLLYSNATCTTGVIEVYRDTSCATAPLPYAMEYQYDPCETKPSHLWARGNPISLAQYYYKSSTGVCQGPYATYPEYDYFSVATEVKTAELVQINLGSPVGTGRLSTRYYESADGMRLQGTIHDAVLGSSCTGRVYTPDAADGYCIPPARTASYEEDAGCTKPKLSISKQCTPPKFAIDYPTPYCSTVPATYYALGPSVAGAPLYIGSPGSCTASTPSTASNYYKVDEKVTLGSLKRTIGTDGQRIKLIHYTNDEGLKFRNYALYDSQRLAECTPTKLPDGTIRCVVSGSYTQSFFSNAACTTPVDVVLQTTGTQQCPGLGTPKYARKYVAPLPGSCTYGQQIFPINTQYTGALFQNNGTCTAYAVPAGYAVYSIGAQIPLTDFVSASISIDP